MPLDWLIVCRPLLPLDWCCVLRARLHRGMATTSASGAAAGGRSSGGGGSKGGCSPGDSLQLVCSETAPKPLDDKERMLSLQVRPTVSTCLPALLTDAWCLSARRRRLGCEGSCSIAAGTARLNLRC